MKQNKSAKDMAFEKERAKYRKELRELESELKHTKLENIELKNKIEELECKCDELQEWINRLLEYTEMSEEDMRRLIQKEKIMSEASEHIGELFGIFGRFGGGYFR
mgnify:CR=1 FL=1